MRCLIIVSGKTHRPPSDNGQILILNAGHTCHIPFDSQLRCQRKFRSYIHMDSQNRGVSRADHLMKTLYVRKFTRFLRNIPYMARRTVVREITRIQRVFTHDRHGDG